MHLIHMKLFTINSILCLMSHKKLKLLTKPKPNQTNKAPQKYQHTQRRKLTFSVLLVRDGRLVHGTDARHAEIGQFTRPSTVHHAVRTLQVTVVTNGTFVNIF